MKPAFKSSTLLSKEREIPTDNTNLKEYISEMRDLFNLVQYFIKNKRLLRVTIVVMEVSLDV